jgi:hypothetical protein
VVREKAVTIDLRSGGQLEIAKDKIKEISFR